MDVGTWKMTKTCKILFKVVIQATVYLNCMPGEPNLGIINWDVTEPVDILRHISKKFLQPNS